MTEDELLQWYGLHPAGPDLDQVLTRVWHISAAMAARTASAAVMQSTAREPPRTRVIVFIGVHPQPVCSISLLGRSDAHATVNPLLPLVLPRGLYGADGTTGGTKSNVIPSSHTSTKTTGR
jgi:hypothetical protein